MFWPRLLGCVDSQRLRLDSLIGLVIECGAEIKGTGRCLAPRNCRFPRGMRGDFPAIMKVITDALLGNYDHTENIRLNEYRSSCQDKRHFVSKRQRIPASKHQNLPRPGIMSYDIEEHVTDKYEIRKRIGKGVRKFSLSLSLSRYEI